MFDMWFVEDFLSGKVLGDRYFSDKIFAVAYRNQLGYGFVRQLKQTDRSKHHAKIGPEE